MHSSQGLIELLSLHRLTTDNCILFSLVLRSRDKLSEVEKN